LYFQRTLASLNFKIPLPESAAVQFHFGAGFLVNQTTTATSAAIEDAKNIKMASKNMGDRYPRIVDTRLVRFPVIIGGRWNDGDGGEIMVNSNVAELASPPGISPA